MTRPTPPMAGPPSDEQLVAMLRTIGDREVAGEQLDSTSLGRCLGWTSLQTSRSLVDAKARLLIWAIRVGSKPGPCFEEIELTVQGRRFLTAAGPRSAAVDTPAPTTGVSVGA